MHPAPLTVPHAPRRNRHWAKVTAAIVCVAFALVAILGCEPNDLVFSPAALPEGQVGSPYSATITVSQAHTPVGGGGVSAGGLPAGLDLAVSEKHDNTILISGTPTVAGTFHFTVSVWCYGTNVSGQTGSRDYVLVVK